jgi:hypothetical protein
VVVVVVVVVVMLEEPAVSSSLVDAAAGEDPTDALPAPFELLHATSTSASVAAQTQRGA